MKPAIEIMRERAAAAVRELLARVPAGSVRAVFVGGSVGRGEVWSASRAGILEIFSDIDLYVIVADDADASLVRRAGCEAASMLPAASDGVMFRRGVDVGVYRLDDLLAQPVRPGTVDLAEHHLWLFGDRAVVAGLAHVPARAMDPTEALYLLENRAWDLLEASAEEVTAAAAKSILDVMAAHLIAEGRFAPTYQARRAADQSQPVRFASSAARTAVESAERFRRGEDSHPVQIAPGDALALLVEAWCSLGASILFGEEGRADPVHILSVRCARAHRLSNYREFVRSRHRMGLSKLSAALAGVRFTALSPQAALRTHAIVRGLIDGQRVAAHAVAFHSSYVARLTARIAPGEAELERRVRVAMKASV
jgi:hypothetical protein